MYVYLFVYFYRRPNDKYDYKPIQGARKIQKIPIHLRILDLRNVKDF